MNRPRIVGILSAVIGSTAGFLVLHRWRLAGTITGAAAMPVIYALVTHCSHASLESLRKWLRTHVRKEADTALAELAATHDSAEPTGSGEPLDQEPRAPRSMRPAGRGLQWSAATLAFLAFAASVYSLARSDPGTTILREKVVQTVTVTTEHSSLALVKGWSDAATVTGLPGSQDSATTTTASATASSDTTGSTEAGSAVTTTTLP
jgi:hypothetical protein